MKVMYSNILIFLQIVDGKQHLAVYRILKDGYLNDEVNTQLEAIDRRMNLFQVKALSIMSICIMPHSPFDSSKLEVRKKNSYELVD